MLALLCRALALENDALEFFEDKEVLVGLIDFGVALLFCNEEADFFEALEFALNITGIFFDELGEATYMRLKIRILRVYYNDFPAHPRCDECV